MAKVTWHVNQAQTNEAKVPRSGAGGHDSPRLRRADTTVIGRAIRTERYRLGEWKKPGAPAETADLELCDYSKDPIETENLAAARPEVVTMLRRILARHPEAR